MNKIKKFLAVACSLAFLTGWGAAGHSKINLNTVLYFPKEMSQFTSWNTILQQHASDADNRKGSDRTEGPKHYIDIENYPGFTSTGKINESYSAQITSEGVLPWATITTFDSLKNAFQRKDWTKAQLFASDLGHYVGDGQMPLHITKYFNGRNGVQVKIHDRYDDIARQLPTQIVFVPDTVQYVSDVSRFVFDYLYANNRYVDSVYYADSVALKKSNGQTNSDYYRYFWENGKDYTNMLFNRAAKSLAALIYTAWVNAGKPQVNPTYVEVKNNVPEGFNLMQNYPNPFNPETVIKYRINTPGHVRLSLFNVLGKEVATLFEGDRPQGEFSLKVNANSLNIESGIYFYRLQGPGLKSQVRKMNVLK